MIRQFRTTPLLPAVGPLFDVDIENPRMEFDSAVEEVRQGELASFGIVLGGIRSRPAFDQQVPAQQQGCGVQHGRDGGHVMVDVDAKVGKQKGQPEEDRQGDQVELSAIGSVFRHVTGLGSGRAFEHLGVGHLR